MKTLKQLREKAAEICGYIGDCLTIEIDEQIRQNYCPQYFVFVNGKMRLQVACVDGKFWETSEKIDIFLSGFWYGNMYNK